MSHYHERKEKICLNCSAALHGRYCHNCGQENIEPKETAWGLVTHFLYDITHFDGKFFSTVKYLVTRPGYLSKEYISGRRANYLHPIRMYVFTSAFFFIVFFSRVDVNKMNPDVLDNTVETSFTDSTVREDVLKESKSQADSATLEKGLDNIKKIPGVVGQKLRESREKDGVMLNLYKTKYTSKASYDSAQKSMIPALRDSWVRTRMVHKQFDLNEKFAKSPRDFFFTWLNLFIHSFPQLLFVSLPLFALSLQLLYIRHKQYYYADHIIFSIHLYIFTFIGLLVSFLLSELARAVPWSVFNYLNFLLAIYLVYYSYKAMRNFYRQKSFKTFVKYCLLAASSFVVIVFLFVVFLFLSFLKF